MKPSLRTVPLIAVVAVIFGLCAAGPDGTIRTVLVNNKSFHHCAWVSIYTSRGRAQWKLVVEPGGAPRFVAADHYEKFHVTEDIELQVRAQMTPDRNCTKASIAEASASAYGLRDNWADINDAGSGFKMSFRP